MTYQEKENVVNIFSGLLITMVYSWIVYQKHVSGVIDLTADYRKWGVVFLIFIGVSVVARIIIYIIFHIINAIATREDKIPVEDERVKLIKLKGMRNSYYVFSGGFVLGILGLSIGLPVYSIFIVFIISGLLSEVVDNGTQIYFHRKGL
ncbi:hypothetical protein [Saccharicrinis sp. FJH54]|uniref:hypothetical protein n=1 Tax=Saccharicrinis sp. FJH54 TaxID=3344665 RepID=UPI0035D424F6